MSAANISIVSFDPKQATDQDWEALTRLANQRQSIINPDDPPVDIDQTRRNWLSTPPVVTEYHWLAWRESEAGSGEQLIGRGEIGLINMEENKHLAQGNLFVLPEYRRRGIGLRLLELMARQSLAGGRTVFITSVFERDPDGQAFAEHIGAQVGLATHLNQLKMSELNKPLMRSWIERAPESAAGFSLEFWDGPYPEADIEQAAAVTAAMNQAPTGDLDVQDFNYTPDLLRQIESAMQAQGVSRWTYAAREKATGALAGFTEVMFRPDRPNIGYQGNTGVLEQYRGHGLGRWLKAAMLQRILDEKPAITLIRTGNADENAPMLKINTELGFKPYQANSIVQMRFEKVLEYLGKR
jgi:mycothiol synthase